MNAPTPKHSCVPPTATAAQGRWLVSSSLILAVALEVLPIEADFQFALRNDMRLFLVVKAVFLMVILAPLVLYAKRNGQCGILAVKRRVIAIGMIVVLKLALDISGLVHWLMRG